MRVFLLPLQKALPEPISRFSFHPVRRAHCSHNSHNERLTNFNPLVNYIWKFISACIGDISSQNFSRLVRKRLLRLKYTIRYREEPSWLEFVVATRNFFFQGHLGPSHSCIEPLYSHRPTLPGTSIHDKHGESHRRLYCLQIQL